MKNAPAPGRPSLAQGAAAAALSRTHTHPRPAEMAKKGTSPSFTSDEKKAACVPRARARVPAWQPLAARARPPTSRRASARLALAAPRRGRGARAFANLLAARARPAQPLAAPTPARPPPRPLNLRRPPLLARLAG